MFIWGMLRFFVVRYILKPESVITNIFYVPSHTLTLWIPKFQPDIEFPIKGGQI